MWTGFVWLKIGAGEFGIELSGSINCWETIKCPNNYGSLE
jgi:hypothetical protein